MKTTPESSPRLLDRFLNVIENAPGSDRLILRLAFFVMIGTGIWLTLSFNQDSSETTPTRGGSITEGIIGIPRFINPVLAITRADQDVTALVYSGLMRISSTGSLENDLAETIAISDDGLIYTVTLHDNVTFHDGTPLTADDIIYTISLIQDPDINSTLRGNWTDIIVEKISNLELTITLEEAYAPFVENFTFGILPAHAWSVLPTEQLSSSQLNTEPIGTGPFAVTAAERDTSGLIKRYTLTAFRNNSLDPKINTIELAFFPNEEELLTALSEHNVDATTYLQPEHVDEVLNKNYYLIAEPLPRTFSIFFNQNRSTALRDDAARKALTVALNRDVLIENTLYGHGVPIDRPISFFEATLQSVEGNQNLSTSTPLEEAVSILKAGGWSKNNLNLWEKEIDKETVTLSVTLRTRNTPLLEDLADLIVKQWKALGVEVATEQFEKIGLTQSVIRPRNFEALLFGFDMTRSHDLYPFWHSSQQDDPGLNISQYANVTVDDLLEKARVEQSNTERLEILQKASLIIFQERPAIFLFQPSLTYLVSNNITIAEMKNLGRPSDRFSNVANWHAESKSLWPIFRNNF